MKNLLAAGVVCLMTAGLAAQAPDTKLSFAAPPSLVDCDGRPCVWISLNRIDDSGGAHGLPTDVPAYKVEDLRGPKELKVFYVTEMANTDEVQRKPMYSMLLFDLSGSMLFPVAGGGAESRFDAANAVLRDFISTSFTEKIDNWSIVGFESHHVADRIRQATFASTRQEALDQLRQLGTPQPRNDTGLYTAIDEALPLLRAKKKAGYDVRLFVFTDGKNDPGVGGDADLLTGEAGRRLVVKAAELTEVEIITIGFGKRGDPSFEEETLKSLAFPTAANYHYAFDRESLAKVFKGDQDLRAKRVRISVILSEKEKNELTQPIPLRVYLVGKDRAQSVKETEIPFKPKGLPIPVWEGRISGKELTAFADLQSEAGPDRLLVKMLIFTGFLAFFALAWFGMPRVVWPESFIPKPRLPNVPMATGLESVTPQQSAGDAVRSRAADAPPPPQRGAAPPPAPRQAPRVPTRSETPSARQGSASGEWRPPRAPSSDDATRYGSRGGPPQGPGPDDWRQRPPGDAPRRPDEPPPPRGGGQGPDDWRPRGGPGGGGGGAGPAPRRPAPPQPARRPEPEPPRSSDDATVYIPRGKKYEQDT